MPEIPPKSTEKPHGVTYGEVLAIARSLNEDHILTSAWTEEKLLSKRPSTFEEAELKGLKKELEDHLNAYAKANA